MSKPEKIENIDTKELVEEGMKEVHKKLRKDKIKSGDPLVVSKDGNVVALDPATMKEINKKEEG